MADRKGLWQRMPTLAQTAFVLSLTTICFLLVSLGLTSQTISEHRDFVKYLEQYTSSASGGSSSSSSSSSTNDISTSSRSAGRSSSRSFSIVSLPFTTTRTSLTADPAGYTSTFLTTWTDGDGLAYRTLTEYYGEPSAYTTFTSTGYSLSRATELVKRSHAETTTTAPTALSKSAHSQVDPTLSLVIPKATPTRAPSIFGLQRSYVHADQRRGTTLKLHRRQSTETAARELIDVANKRTALDAVILVATILQLLLCVAFIAILCVSYEPHKTNDRLLRTSAMSIALFTSLTSLLIFVFAIASIAYGTSEFGQSVHKLAPNLVFWIASSIFGFAVANNAYKLGRQPETAMDSTMEVREGGGTVKDRRRDAPHTRQDPALAQTQDQSRGESVTIRLRADDVPASPPPYRPV